MDLSRLSRGRRSIGRCGSWFHEVSVYGAHPSMAWGGVAVSARSAAQEPVRLAARAWNADAGRRSTAARCHARNSDEDQRVVNVARGGL